MYSHRAQREIKADQGIYRKYETDILPLHCWSHIQDKPST